MLVGILFLRVIKFRYFTFMNLWRVTLKLGGVSAAPSPTRKTPPGRKRAIPVHIVPLLNLRQNKMKITRSTILLSITLLGIWGGIGFMIYNSTKVKGLESNQKPEKNIAPSKKFAAYTLLLNYKDPFANYITGISQKPFNATYSFVKSQNSSNSKVNNQNSKSLCYLGVIRVRKKTTEAYL